MSIYEAAKQALEALFLIRDGATGLYGDDLTRCNRALEILSAAISDEQDWGELEALRASLREHMDEIHRLRAAGRRALEALEAALSDDKPYIERCKQSSNALRAALEPVTDCHGLEQARSVAISNLLAHFGITSEDSNVNVAYIHKQLDDFLMAAIGCNREGDKLPLPLKIEECGYPNCLSTNGCERQCPAFPRGKDDDKGETSDVPETNFGNMAQAVDSTEADHIAGVGKMVDQSEDSLEMLANVREDRTVEPVAYVTGYFGGRCVIRPVEPVIFPVGMALYRASQEREPLTYEEATVLTADCLWSDMMKFVRAIERAHGIGGEE